MAVLFPWCQCRATQNSAGPAREQEVGMGRELGAEEAGCPGSLLGARAAFTGLARTFHLLVQLEAWKVPPSA